MRKKLQDKMFELSYVFELVETPNGLVNNEDSSSEKSLTTEVKDEH